jgi:hypothetical protein
MTRVRSRLARRAGQEKAGRAGHSRSAAHAPRQPSACWPWQARSRARHSLRPRMRRLPHGVDVEPLAVDGTGLIVGKADTTTTNPEAVE